MGYTYFLTPDEDLETIRANLAKKIGRPVYIAGTRTTEGTDAIYRRPGKRAYKTLGRLEMFLSQWDTSPCLERTDTYRRFDLIPASYLHLVYPLTAEERKGEDYFVDRNFRSIGMVEALNGDRTIVYPSLGDEIPVELEPYYIEYRRHVPRSSDGKSFRMQKGIRFAVSELIEAPKELREQWSLGLEFGRPTDTLKGVEFKGWQGQSILAPGHYSGKKLNNVESVNRLCFVDREPGKCVCCHGRSGERKHFAVVVTGGESYPEGLICRTCFPEAVKQWGELLDKWEPAAVGVRESA